MAEEHEVGTEPAEGSPGDPRPGARRRRGWLGGLGAVVVVALVMGLVLASGSTPGSRPTAAAAATVQRAVVVTTKSPTVTFQLHESVTTSEGALDLRGTGVASTATGEASIDATTSGAVSMSMHEVVLRGMAYVRYNGAIASQLPTPWISIPTAHTAFQASAPSSPLVGLAALMRSGLSVSRVGTATVLGQSTTEYDVTFTPAYLKRRLASIQSKLPSWMRSTTAPKGLTSADVWIGHDGRVRQVSMDVTATTAGQTVSADITVTFVTYGGTLHVTPPPASQVTPLAQVESSLG